MCKKKNRSIVKEKDRTVAHPVRVYAFICICIYIYARNIFWDYESRSMRSRRRKRLLTTRFTEFHGSRGGERKDWRARLVRTDENSERRSERIRAVLVVAIR